MQLVSAYLIRVRVPGVDHVHAGGIQDGLHLLLEALHLRQGSAAAGVHCGRGCQSQQRASKQDEHTPPP